MKIPSLYSIWNCFCKLRERVKTLEDAEPTYQVVTERFVFASGKSDGNQYRCAVTNLANGLWLVAFLDANGNDPFDHPEGENYEVVFGTIESGAERDVPKISIVEGSQTAAQFEVQVTLDDNGGNADTYSDDNWSFACFYSRQILVPVTED